MRSKSNQTGMHSAASVSPDEFRPAYLDEALPQGDSAQGRLCAPLPVHREIFVSADKRSQG
jgi:hypothetical protein